MKDGLKKTMLVMALVLAMAGSASALTSLAFDFGYDTDTPAGGYTLVGAGHNGGAAKQYNATDGFGYLGYGDVKARAVTTTSDLRLDSAHKMSTETFRVDVNNGNYLLEVVGGISFDHWGMWDISGDNWASYTHIGRDASYAYGHTPLADTAMPYTYKLDGNPIDMVQAQSTALEAYLVPAHYKWLQGLDVPIAVTAGNIQIRGYIVTNTSAISYLEVAQVPEPISMSLLCVGGMVLLRRKRR